MIYRELHRLIAATSLFLLCAALPGACLAQPASQTPQAAVPDLPQPLNWTAAQDHQNMMDQLGIKAVRPGPSGNENAPNHANYDEAQANPFPSLPDALTLKNARRVTKASVWWNKRRPEGNSRQRLRIYCVLDNGGRRRPPGVRRGWNWRRVYGTAGTEKSLTHWGAQSGTEAATACPGWTQSKKALGTQLT